MTDKDETKKVTHKEHITPAEADKKTTTPVTVHEDAPHSKKSGKVRGSHNSDHSYEETEGDVGPETAEVTVDPADIYNVPEKRDNDLATRPTRLEDTQ